MRIAVLTLLLIYSSLLRAEDTCAYFSKKTTENSYPEWQPYENCATYINGVLEISPNHLSNIGFGSSGLAPFWVAGQHFYIKASGEFLPVISYDNGADIFREDLVRSVIKSKIAYYNPTLEMVIAPKYDWGWPFYNGRALVCLGCVIEKADRNGHKPVAGGLWGYIDKTGKEVVPVKYKQNEVPAQ